MACSEAYDTDKQNAGYGAKAGRPKTESRRSDMGGHLVRQNSEPT